MTYGLEHGVVVEVARPPIKKKHITAQLGHSIISMLLELIHQISGGHDKVGMLSPCRCVFLKISILDVV